jgi:hypothetical protein
VADDGHHHEVRHLVQVGRRLLLVGPGRKDLPGRPEPGRGPQGGPVRGPARPGGGDPPAPGAGGIGSSTRRSPTTRNDPDNLSPDGPRGPCTTWPGARPCTRWT